MIQYRYVLPLLVVVFLLGFLAGLFLATQESPRIPSAKRAAIQEPVAPLPVMQTLEVKAPEPVVTPDVSVPIPAQDNTPPKEFALHPVHESLGITISEAREMAINREWNATWLASTYAALEAPLTEDYITIHFRCWKRMKSTEVFYPDEVRYSGIGVTADAKNQTLKMEPHGILAFDLYFKSPELLATQISRNLFIQVVWDRMVGNETRYGEHRSMILDSSSIEPKNKLYTLTWDDLLRGMSPTYEWDTSAH